MNPKINAFRATGTFLLLSLIISCTPSKKYYLLVGTYTQTGSKGIYVYDFNPDNGDFHPISHTDSATNPSYITLSKDQQYVYAVNESNGSNPGRVSAYSFDKKEGKLHFLNTTFSGGDDPCFVSVSSSNRWLTAANYSSGSTAVFPLHEDGSVGPYSQLIHDSVYREPGEVATAHVHETVFSPDERFLLTPDLGLDRVVSYLFQPASPQPLKLSPVPFTKSLKGTGPRHIVFHPNGKWAYLMHEMGGNITAYDYKDGNLTQVQDLPTYTEGFSGKKDGAEVVISPDGKFLYTSNRGDLDAITIFSIDPGNGKLTLKGFQPALGNNPRNFIIDPSGNYLLVANQNSDNIVIFNRDKRTGMLSPSGKQIGVPMPVSLQMATHP